MEVTPIVSDSLGVRSLSVFVEADSHSILIDGGARVGPLRFGLPPTEKENQTLKKYRTVIEEYARKADVVVISHYHYDHYLPDFSGYAGKTIYVKDPESNINFSQKRRGKLFRDIWTENANIITADGKNFKHGNLLIKFSEPVPHGEEDSPLGFVIMTGVEDENTGETLLHTSDIQGPISKSTCKKIIEYSPDILIADGPPTYLREWDNHVLISQVEKNLKLILESFPGEFILDHHNSRDIDWQKHFSISRKTNRIKNFAEFLKKRPLPLEGMRREIRRSENGKDKKTQ